LTKATFPLLSAANSINGLQAKPATFRLQAGEGRKGGGQDDATSLTDSGSAPEEEEQSGFKWEKNARTRNQVQYIAKRASIAEAFIAMILL
jgi:hypothetical protein